MTEYDKQCLGQKESDAFERIFCHLEEKIVLVHKKNNLFDEIDFWISRYKIETPEDLIIMAFLKGVKQKKLRLFLNNFIKIQPEFLNKLKSHIYIESNIILCFILDLIQILKFIEYQTEDDINTKYVKIFLENNLKFWEKVLSET